MVDGYFIESLNKWTPYEPVYSCPDIDNIIEAVESVREINKDLRDALEEAVETIKELDKMVCELEAELNKLEVQEQ